LAGIASPAEKALLVSSSVIIWPPFDSVAEAVGAGVATEEPPPPQDTLLTKAGLSTRKKRRALFIRTS
jgi:hypothetical protein